MRQYPVLESLFPPRANPPRADPLRRAGAPVVAAPPRRQAGKRPSLPEGAVSTSLGSASELIEFMVYGTDEHDTPEIHLAFREDVMAGVYLKLRFETRGVQAVFIVRDAAGRRLAKSYGEDILARLAKKGLRTDAVVIEDAKA